MKKKCLLIVLAVLLLSLPLLGMGMANLVVYDLTRPKPAEIPVRTELESFPLEEVSFEASDGITLAGWHVRVPGKKAVILLHGIGGNRTQHMAKIGLFAQLGYSVLSYDSRSHGMSQETQVTGGWEERLDLEAAMAYMRAQGYEHVGLDGFSMGAATITFGDQDKLKPGFVVLESCYKDVDTLIHNAVAMLGLPVVLAEPVLWRMSNKLGMPISTLSPIERLAKVTAPTLILLGDSEFQVHKDQADEMLAASAAKVKHLFMFENAGHDVFSQTQPELYKEKLVAFLKEAEGSKFEYQYLDACTVVF